MAIDRDGRFIEWNEAAKKLFGWCKEEVLGKPMVSFLLPDRYREAHLKGIKKFFETGEGPILGKRLELFALRQDGSEIPVSLSVIPIQIGENLIFAA